MGIELRLDNRHWFTAAILCSTFIACGGTVINGAGGSGGTTSKGPTSSPATSTGSIVPTSTGSSGGNLCQDAADSIQAKLNACGITASTTSTGDGSTGTGMQMCTATQGLQAKALAACVNNASCEALKGQDTAGAQVYAKCIEDAASGSTSASTTGSGG